jgi:hypothetical protein
LVWFLYPINPMVIWQTALLNLGSPTKENPMNAASAPKREDWQDLYRAALCESDRTEIISRIASAEQRIAARERELFNDRNPNITERNALNVALFSLQALKSSLNWRIRGNSTGETWRSH